MNSRSKVVSLGMSLLVGAGLSSPAFAQMEPGDWSVSLAAGGSFAVGGTMHRGANAPVADLGALNPALAGIPATLQIQERSQNDVYDTGWSIGGEVGYALSNSGEILLGVRYLEANGNRINVGSAAAGAPVNASLPIYGNFGNYKALSIEAGYRQYLGSAGGVKPFIAARAGTTRISKIFADFTVPDAGIALNKVPFSKSGWGFSGGAALGVSIPLDEKVSIEPEVGVHYIDGAKGNDAALGGLGLGGINDSGQRWSVPISVRLKVAL